MGQVLQPADRDEFGYPTRPDTRRQLRNSVVHTSRRILLYAIYLCMSVVGIGLWLNRLTKKYTPLAPPHFHPRRILVIRLDLIGDLVLSLTVVQALKKVYPEAEIDLLATPGSANVVARHPDIHAIISYDPNIWRRPRALLRRQNWREALALVRSLRARHYDLAISVFGSWASVIAVLSGAVRRIGFAQEAYPGFMTDPVPGKHWRAGDHLHEVDYCLQLAHAAGASVSPEDRVPHLPVDPQAVHEIEQLLFQEGWNPEQALVACHISSNNGQSKRWPVPYWAALIDRLIREERALVVLTGAPGDLPLIEELLGRTRERPLNLAGKTSLVQLAALLWRAGVLVTGDSGPMHIGAAVGTLLVAIHGPTDPALSGPVSSRATILRDTIWCSPCYTASGPANCRFFTTQCMKNIVPERVYEAVKSKLVENHPGRPQGLSN
ncbi:MAG TPA: lipopolysaccharide heptosyltransferase II [Ktedonobacteraceae bacterium]|jgi:lipopolysaccharide heptosyltransferase II